MISPILVVNWPHSEYELCHGTMEWNKLASFIQNKEFINKTSISSTLDNSFDVLCKINEQVLQSNFLVKNISTID